jgi:hypothetical protein
MRFGDLDFKKEPVGNFYGSLDEPSLPEKAFFNRLFAQKQELTDGYHVDGKKHMTALSSRDAKLHHLYATTTQKKSHKAQLDLTFEITKRMRTDHVFESFAPQGLQAGTPILPRNFDCLKTLMKSYDKECGKMDDYSL